MVFGDATAHTAPRKGWLRGVRGVARLAMLALGVATVIALVPLAALAAFTPAPGSAPQRMVLDPPSPRVFGAAASDAKPEELWHEWTVRSGDTLARLFDRSGLDRRDLARLLAEGTHAARLARLQPGEKIRYQADEAGRLRALAIEPEPSLRVIFELEDGSLRERAEALPVETRVGFALGTIESSLFDAGQEAGLTDALILQMADALGYDIDFALDLRAGDRFALFYQQPFRDGEPIGRAELLAVSFVNRGKRYDALRFQRRDGTVGFYDAEGRPLRKAFLRTPVEFTRISSRFALARKHPILGRMRAHRGVDYAAPTGTPVRAAGDGRILAIGNQGGYGKTVVIDHGRGITTLYAHLSRFAPGLARGSRVRQGQTIGFVGMTGLATGPHLHYEFRVHGVHRDPLTIPLPRAEPLPPAELAEFRRQAGARLAQIERLGGIEASASDRPGA